MFTKYFFVMLITEPLQKRALAFFFLKPVLAIATT